jgi:hypothetical protein
MCIWGYSGPSVCLFCHGSQETKQRLFFECSFSRRIWRVLLADCEVVDPPLEWNEVINWFKAIKSRNSLKIAILQALSRGSSLSPLKAKK